jgi:hypothetical protein
VRFARRISGHKRLAGESFSIYDVSRKVWHQTWVTDRGKLLVIEGGLQQGAMVLSAMVLRAVPMAARTPSAARAVPASPPAEAFATALPSLRILLEVLRR